MEIECICSLVNRSLSANKLTAGQNEANGRSYWYWGKNSEFIIYSSSSYLQGRDPFP